MTRLRLISLTALTAVLLGAAPALAQSPVDDAYGTTTRLPFSGLDLGLIAMGGIVLVVAGIALRHAVRTDS